MYLICFILRSTNDDVDVLKRVLISVQQRMNEMALEKERQIDKLRFILTETYDYILKFDHLEQVFNQVKTLILNIFPIEKYIFFTEFINP